MRYSLARLNVVYERPFRQPVFQVSKSAVEILDCLYGRLNPKYPMAMSDLTASSALSMGEIAIRARLFNGNGLLELSVEKFTARFEGLRNKQDVEIVKDAITLSEDALENALPGTNYEGAAIRTSAWLSCDDGDQGVQDLLEKFGTPKLKLRRNEFGAEKIKTPVRAQLTNEKEGWAVNFFLDTSELAGAHLFFLCDGVYIETGKFSNFAERANHLENVYEKLLEHYGLEPISD